MQVTEKHALWLRLLHWFNVPMTLMMIWSGILIYWASDVYPGFFPQWFYTAFGIRGRLAEGLSIHFMIGWFFILNGLLYLIALAVSGHWRELVPTRKTLRWVVPTLLDDLGVKRFELPKEKFNAIQRIAYTSVIILAILAVLSGFAIYKPVQLSWLTFVFGGYKGARLVHFVVMISLVMFILVHVLQVIRAGWNNFRAMVAGFEVNDEK